MPTICIGRKTIESLSTGSPVALGQDCYAVPASGFDHPYKRIAELEAAIREYLGEHDTPAKDLLYRARCRDRLRTLVNW